MPFFQLQQTQKIPGSLDVVWDFISNPANLKDITPPYMSFRVTSGYEEKKMYPGMIIAYKVKPVLGISVTWVTEITQVKDRSYFVDEQRMGPYKLWHHQHKLQEIENGVLMTDIVTYIPPFGFIGKFANSLFIKKQLDQIFEYRKTALIQKFGRWQADN